MTDRGPTGGLVALATVALLCVGLVLAPRTVRGADPSFFADSPPPELFLLYTGDVIGYVDPCG